MHQSLIDMFILTPQQQQPTRQNYFKLPTHYFKQEIQIDFSLLLSQFKTLDIQFKAHIYQYKAYLQLCSAIYHWVSEAQWLAPHFQLTVVTVLFGAQCNMQHKLWRKWLIYEESDPATMLFNPLGVFD